MKMKTTKRIAISLLLALFCISMSAADQLAFPGAQGWGRFAKGARASSSPTVYHVTNLNDSGTGSLRDAVSQPNRIVVFDVSGVIKLTGGRIVFSKNLYVAGQTAPGEGITVYGNGVSFSGASNIIVRYLRIRMGRGGDNEKDCAGVANGTNMIFDHCSFSWGLDETFSINPDDKGDLGDITLMNTIIGQGLLTHSAGGLVQADHITLYRNLYIDNSTRNNKVKGISQYVNNVVYNWQNGCYIMGGESAGSSYVNIENNLFINGPAKGGNALGGGNSDFHFYGNDNWQDSNLDGVLNPSLITSNGGGDQVATPYDYPELEKYNGRELIEKNIPTVGASLPYRDLADCYMVEELLSYGKKGALLTYETSLPIGAPTSWAWYKGSKKTDTDGDGMPDEWETANGTNPSQADATVLAANGYLNIENYINSISVDTREYFLRAPYFLDAAKRTATDITLSWSDYTDNETGFAVEVKKDGTWQEVGRTAANSTSFNMTGLTPGTPYEVRVCAIGSNSGSETHSEFATATVSTRQEEQDVIDIATYQPDVTLGAGQTTWDFATTEWKEGKAYKDNDNVLISVDDTCTVSISGSVQPNAVVAIGSGKLTLDGIIAGSGSMNKAGTGTLVLGNANTYSGATVLHEGTIEFGKLANGGEASSIGASQSDAQNWVFDGGTYKYTGGNTATNRDAQLLRATTLNIANSGATITANGSFEGNGDLILDGAGTLSVADAAKFFTYSGSTVLKGGTLYLSDVEKSAKIFASSNHKVVMSGGTLKFNYKKDDSQTYQIPIEVTEGTVSKIMIGTTGSINSNISGTGTLIFDIPYVRAYINSQLPNFTGKIIADGQTTSGNFSLFYHNSQWNTPNVRYELKGKTYMGAWTTNATNIIGGLSGDAGTYLVGSSKNTKNFKCSWTVGGANTDETFKGIINNWDCGGADRGGVVSITKTGTGYWRLTGKNIYSGTTTVSQGKLIVNGQHTGTGAVTVAEGATLAGTGKLAGATTVNGTLMVGDEKATDKGLTFSGGLKLGSAAVLQLNEAMAEKTYYTGDELQAFTGTATGTFAEILPTTPGEGLAWDTSELYSKGLLKVSGGSVTHDPDPDPTPEPAKQYKQQVMYSWESPEGTVIQVGGTATMKNAPSDAADRVNYLNSTYYTISLNGKSGDMNGAASNNGTYIQLDLDEALAEGDSIWITAYQNKGTEAKGTPYIVAGTCVINDGVAFNDIADGSSLPNTRSYVLSSGAEGEKVMKLTRGTMQGTNLFITKFVITRWVEDSSATPDPVGISHVVSGTDSVEYYTTSGERITTPGKGMVIMRTTTADGKVTSRKICR